MGPFALPGTVITRPQGVKRVRRFACPGQIISSITPLNFIKFALIVPELGGGGGWRELLHSLFSLKRGINPTNLIKHEFNSILT